MNISPEHYLLLSILRGGESYNQQKLADLIFKDKATITRMIDSLTRAGYINRVSDPSDRRNKMIVITEKGKQVHTILKETYRELSHRALRDIGEEKLESLVECLENIHDNLKQVSY